MKAEVRINIKATGNVYWIEDQGKTKVPLGNYSPLNETEVFVPVKKILTHYGNIIDAKEEEEFLNGEVKRWRTPKKIKEELHGKKIYYLAKVIENPQKTGYIGFEAELRVEITEKEG